MMGLFDYISFDEPLPEFPVEVITSGINCPQTKSFYFPSMDHYVIRDRKMFLHRKEYRGTGEMEEWTIGDRSLGTREKQELVREWDERIPYHGDISLSCDTPDGKYVRLVARFTEGELQWIETEEDYDVRTQARND